MYVYISSEICYRELFIIWMVDYICSQFYAYICIYNNGGLFALGNWLIANDKWGLIQRQLCSLFFCGNSNCKWVSELYLYQGQLFAQLSNPGRKLVTGISPLFLCPSSLLHTYDLFQFRYGHIVVVVAARRWRIVWSSWWMGWGYCRWRGAWCGTIVVTLGFVPGRCWGRHWAG